MMAVLSTIVAVIGFYKNSVAILIGAMVIAPLIGPSMAFSLATTLFEYIEGYYNRKRLHSTLGYLSPEMFENHYYKQRISS